MMNTERMYLAVIIFVAALACVDTSHAADQRFNAASLKGVYGFSGSGSIFIPPTGRVPAAVTGLTTYNGHGGCDTKATLNLGGSVLPLSTVACSYTVDPDGTASQTVTLASPAGTFGTFISDIVIVDGGNELHGILSDPNGATVGTTLSKRQRTK